MKKIVNSFLVALTIFVAALFPVTVTHAKPKACNVEQGGADDKNGASAYFLKGDGQYRVRLLCRKEKTLSPIFADGHWAENGLSSSRVCPDGYVRVNARVDKK